jgi:hypothetical protein
LPKPAKIVADIERFASKISAILNPSYSDKFHFEPEKSRIVPGDQRHTLGD